MADRYTRRRMGDRRDGRRLRTLEPTFQLMPFLMRHPSDAVNSFTDRTDVGPAEAWLRLRRGEGYEDFTLLHIFIAAYVRTLALRPALNRFVAGRFLYARDRIDVVLSAGRNGSADSGALTAKIRFLPTDTIYDVYRKINAQLGSIKADEEAGRIERVASTLVKTPRFVLRMATAVIRWLDYHGWMGTAWTDRSPFHGSVVISDDGANALPSMSRSLSSMGALPMSISIGRRRSAAELTSSGAIEEKRYADYTVSADARIADSAYLGAAFKYFRHYLLNPAELETPPERVNEDTL